jgi:hypothetical protein
MSSLTGTDTDSRARMMAQLARCARAQGGAASDRAEFAPRRTVRRLSTLRADPRLVPVDPLTAHLKGVSTPRRLWSLLTLGCSLVRW